MVDHGVARFISLEEMLELLSAADQEGLVLQPENTKNPLFVCCCCGCCCNVLTSARQFPRPAEYFSSNFCAKVDGDACNACEACVARCQMNAILMVDGNAQVDSTRCIGCSLCVTTCPSHAIRLQKKDTARVPPDNTKALYVQLLQERYGPAGMAKLAARKMLGMKI
jgi:Pyruvate/2-oxoacid:ferredoxin oxidoreductase delta subunit